VRYSGHLGHDHMIDWIYNYLYMQSVPITTNIVSSNPAYVVCTLYSIQHYVIKFVSELQPIGGFLQVHVLWFPPPIKLDCHDVTEILLKVALNTKVAYACTM
jgi:hypothetical protein